MCVCVWAGGCNRRACSGAVWQQPRGFKAACARCLPHAGVLFPPHWPRGSRAAKPPRAAHGALPALRLGGALAPPHLEVSRPGTSNPMIDLRTCQGGGRHRLSRPWHRGKEERGCSSTTHRPKPWPGWEAQAPRDALTCCCQPHKGGGTRTSASPRKAASNISRISLLYRLAGLPTPGDSVHAAGSRRSAVGQRRCSRGGERTGDLIGRAQGERRAGGPRRSAWRRVQHTMSLTAGVDQGGGGGGREPQLCPGEYGRTEHPRAPGGGMPGGHAPASRPGGCSTARLAAQRAQRRAHPLSRQRSSPLPPSPPRHRCGRLRPAGGGTALAQGSGAQHQADSPVCRDRSQSQQGCSACSVMSCAAPACSLEANDSVLFTGRVTPSFCQNRLKRSKRALHPGGEEDRGTQDGA